MVSMKAALISVVIRYTKSTNRLSSSSEDKYDKTNYKVVYICKWIIETDYIFDDGLKTNMKRQKGAMMDTEMSYHLYSPDFHNIRSLGIMEQLFRLLILSGLHITDYNKRL